MPEAPSQTSKLASTFARSCASNRPGQANANVIGTGAAPHPPDLSGLGGNRVFVADRRYAFVGRVTDTVEPELLVDMEADPGWSHDVRAEHPDIVQDLAAKSARLPRFPPLVPDEPDPTTLEELRALGYVR